ncbi:phosphosugar isomerase [Phycicoccus sp. HDW14]|uniref:SIS domain-containing protein n=1 Tax=Phycicoccus sp. HDW14 TaxID=2714941 RepID=UPI00140DF5AF|nr:SIS domain-containing protein [Phycicoccus sp. HDW14]QIM21437.1 phosphosugar isomerase [Phycicoccus sp. HDW14]
MAWVDENRLDDVEALAALDTRDTLRWLASAGAQVRRALVAAEEAGVGRVAGGERPRSVLVAALGGSGIVGDVLDLLAEPGSPVPVAARRDAPLPGWVGPLDLVIAVSQSGRAAGPLALAAEAARRGASLLTVGAAGSPLADVCARARGVHVDVALPAPSSRTALWSLLTPVLVAADALGLASSPPSVLESVADVLDEVAEECRPSSDAFVNPAKVLALGLDGTVPVVLGDGALTGVAACRAAQMLSRTARVPATHGALPDAAASVVATLDGPFGSGLGAAPTGGGDIFADPYLDGPAVPRLGLLALRDPALGPAGASLAEAVLGSARESGVVVLEQEARAGHPVERLASLVALTDYAATYLALGLGLDPSVSRHVTDLRDRTS